MPAHPWIPGYAASRFHQNVYSPALSASRIIPGKFSPYSHELSLVFSIDCKQRETIANANSQWFIRSESIVAVRESRRFEEVDMSFLVHNISLHDGVLIWLRKCLRTVYDYLRSFHRQSAIKRSQMFLVNDRKIMQKDEKWWWDFYEDRKLLFFCVRFRCFDMNGLILILWLSSIVRLRRVCRLWSWVCSKTAAIRITTDSYALTLYLPTTFASCCPWSIVDLSDTKWQNIIF